MLNGDKKKHISFFFVAKSCLPPANLSRSHVLIDHHHALHWPFTTPNDIGWV